MKHGEGKTDKVKSKRSERQRLGSLSGRLVRLQYQKIDLHRQQLECSAQLPDQSRHRRRRCVQSVE